MPKHCIYILKGCFHLCCVIKGELYELSRERNENHNIYFVMWGVINHRNISYKVLWEDPAFPLYDSYT